MRVGGCAGRTGNAGVRVAVREACNFVSVGEALQSSWFCMHTERVEVVVAAFVNPWLQLDRAECDDEDAMRAGASRNFGVEPKPV